MFVFFGSTLHRSINQSGVGINSKLARVFLRRASRSMSLKVVVVVVDLVVVVVVLETL